MIKHSNTLTFQHSRSGFTLIELIIAMAIFTVMSVMIMSVYLNTTLASRKLNATRQVAEVAREITERLSEDVREKGVDILDSFDSTTDMWDGYDYAGSGSEYLSLTGGITYVYGHLTDSGNMKRCLDNTTENIKSDNSIHCGLYLKTGSEYYNIVDSFIPEESKKRVKIQDLKFYVSGGDFTTRKVTLVMTIGLMPRGGIPISMVENTKLQIQTTISERGWKSN